jgi:sulfur-carrier protein adenylyltransferase/sulfurtransferase
MATKIECSLDDIKPLSPEAVKSILNADKEGNYILLDVRQPEEYQDSHIPGAKLIPLGELERRIRELDKDKKS